MQVLACFIVMLQGSHLVSQKFDFIFFDNALNLYDDVLSMLIVFRGFNIAQQPRPQVLYCFTFKLD